VPRAAGPEAPVRRRLREAGRAALSTLATADGFMVLAEDCQGVQPGDLAEYLPLEALLD
jgi:molybdopterin biosynthesis enzyme